MREDLHVRKGTGGGKRRGEGGGKKEELGIHQRGRNRRSIVDARGGGNLPGCKKDEEKAREKDRGSIPKLFRSLAVLVGRKSAWATRHAGRSELQKTTEGPVSELRRTHV